MEFGHLIRTPRVDNVVLHYPLKSEQPGTTVCVTGHHLILTSSSNGNKRTQAPTNNEGRRPSSMQLSSMQSTSSGDQQQSNVMQNELWLLHSSVDSVERKVTGMNGGTLTIRCKDFKTLVLDISGVENCNNLAHSIESLSNLAEVTDSYPFFHRSMSEVFEDGWVAFAVVTEFGKLATHTDDWRISHVNRDFEVCSSYPSAVVVPRTIDDDVLVASALFRHNGRFPVLAYYHNDSRAVIMRCGQPLIGPNGRRCKEDERLLDAALPPGKRGYIVDTRPQNLAQMAKAKGGGFEPEVHYPQWRRVHKAIDRHHVIMDSLCKLVDACTESSTSGVDKWLSRLEASNWLSHVKDVLNCACLVAQCIDREGASVLIHGTDGTDSTLQVSSLSQVILDADCRTVRGFEALVEREWLQAGHPFSQRCRRSAFASQSTTSQARSKDNAPIFLLFLDAVWQIHQQFPCSFEFNESFLVMLFEESYFSRYGTFVGNCERERKELRLSARTMSLWSHVNRPEVLQSYLNPLYEPNSSVVWPSVAPMSLGLWPGVFLRWVVDQSNQTRAYKTITEIKERDKEMKSRVARLRRQLVELEREALENALIQPVEAP